MIRSLVAGSLVLCVLAAPTLAPAQPSSASAAQVADATRLYKNGKSLFEAGRYQEALDELQASYAIAKSPNTLLFIAHCQDKLNQRVDALETYLQTEIDARILVEQGQVKYELALNEAVSSAGSLKLELAELSIVARAVPPGSTLLVDGVPQTRVSPSSDGTMITSVFHEPGSATVTVKPPTGEALSQPVELTAGRKTPVNLTFGIANTNAGGGSGSRGGGPAVGGSSDGLKPPPTATLVAGGVGLVGVGLFGIFGSMASSAASELEACDGPCPPSKKEVRDGGKRDQTIANVSLLVGSLSLATAGVLWIVIPRDDETTARVVPRAPRPAAGPRVGVRLPPGGVEVLGTF